MPQLPPVLRDECSAPFFDGTARGELLVRRCPNGHFLPPHRGSSHGNTVRCDECHSADLEWCAVSGEATLVSWIVVHPREQPPHVAGLVELAEGPWMYALLDVPTDADLAVGQRLAVDFVATDGGETIPAFRPA